MTRPLTETPIRLPSGYAEKPASLGAAAFHGPIGDFTRLVTPQTKADPAAILTTTLAAVGNLIGRNAYIQAEADIHPTNIYVVQVGRTSKGRKGTSWGQVKRLCKEIDATWSQNCIKSGLTSGEGLVWAVRDLIEKLEPIQEKKEITGYRSVIVDHGVEDKRLLCMEGEFASMLKVMEREGNTLSPVVRNAWDSGNLQILSKNSPAQATNAHISIIGHCTKDELLRDLNRTEAGNGFANRFLWVFVERANILPEGGCIPDAALQPIVKRLQAAVKFSQKMREVKRDAEARDLWIAGYQQLSEGKLGLFGAVTSRAEAQVIRLALIYALTDGSPDIKRVHLEAALAVWRYCGDSARYIFGDKLGDPVADEIYQMLKDAPSEGLTRTDISNGLGRNRKEHDITRALYLLLDYGKVTGVKIAGTSGRLIERWANAA